MYKVIIADDEIHICMLLRKLIDWEKLGIEIIGEYHDGKSTLQAIFEEKPDIVVSDIKMPEIDGLEIVKHCNEANIKCAFLLISGHAEFEYARMAIQYNVENYLLKPVNKVELEDNLLQIIKKLDRTIESDEHNSNIYKQLELDKDVLKTQFLNNLIFIPNWLSKQSLKQVQTEFHLDFDLDRPSCIAVLKCANKTAFTDEQHRLLLKQIMNYAQREIQKQQIDGLRLLHFPVLYLLLSADDAGYLTSAVTAIFEQLQTRFFEYCDLTMGVSRLSGGGELSSESREQANKALRMRLNYGNGKIYYFDSLDNNCEPIRVNEYVNEFKISVETVSAERIGRIFDGIIELSTGRSVDLDMLFELLSRISVEFVERVRKQNPDGDEARRVNDELNGIMTNAPSKTVLLSQIKEYILLETSKLNEPESNLQSRQIESAISYINKNYSRDISLNDVSGFVYMNPTYFCTLFKKTTGQNFGDYLQNTRLDRAKELLCETNLPIGSVSESIGYKSAHYFSKVFLKAIGIKPSEYRRLYSNI